MPPKQKQVREVQLKCLYCNTQFAGRYYHGGRITSYLNKHILSNPVCQKYNINNKFNFWGNAVLLTSIINNDDGKQSAKKQQIVATTHQFSPIDFGLTGTTNSLCQQNFWASNHQLLTKLIMLV